MFPALGCSILSGYYNVSGHVRWANAIIFSRVFLFAALTFRLFGGGRFPALHCVGGNLAHFFYRLAEKTHQPL